MTGERVILGEGCVYSSNCKETGLNNNVLVCGSSGSGKTMSITEPRLLETQDTSLIVTVTKRIIVNKYMPLFKQRGYEILDMNFVNPEESNCCFDPLKYLHSFTDVTFLATAIVQADPRKNFSRADPFWDQSAISLFSAEIAYVWLTKPFSTFTDVLKLHDSLVIETVGDEIKTSLDAQFEEFEKKYSDTFVTNCWKSFRILPRTTASCVYGVLNTVLDTIFTPELRKMMSMNKNLGFEGIAMNKTVLFITTSAVNPALHYFINLFYSQAFKQLFEFAEICERGVLPIPVHMLCDDFATGGRVLNFPEYISIFREKGLSVTLLLQSESQLEQIYGQDNAVTIINNCDSYVYLGGMDIRTAHNISLRLNVPLEDVLYMPVGREVVFRRGQRPVETCRYNIEEDATYKKVTKAYDTKERRKKIV